MKIAIVICLSLLSFTSNAQSADEEAVKKTIEIFFDGFHQQDSSIIKSVVSDAIILQTTGLNKDGSTLFKTIDFSTFLKNIVGIPKAMEFEERRTSYTIQVDRTMANAWVGYEFWRNKEFSHCGINSFQLLNFDGEWKIIYLIDTRGKEGCLEGH